jgi:hypothetical protein
MFSVLRIGKRCRGEKHIRRIRWCLKREYGVAVVGRISWCASVAGRRSETQVTGENDPTTRDPTPEGGTELERAKLLKATEANHFLFPAFRYKHTKESNVAGSGFYDPTKPMVSWRSGWRTLTQKAGLKGLRFHDLRHHSIKKLAEAGVAEQTLMSIAGHVTKSMLEHYSHIRLTAKRAAVDALDTFNPPAVDTAEVERQSFATVN